MNDDETRVHEMLAQAATLERAPGRDLAPGALKRVRLRGYGVTNANEFLNAFVAFFRSFGTLFALERRNDDEEAPHV